MRNKFDEELETLNLEMIKMGALCEDAIACAAKALLENDGEMCAKAIATDKRIDQMEREIEGLCMRLLLRQQPVAKDLRTVSSALKMVHDMERIGDQASDIAEITRFTRNQEQGFAAHSHIKNMAEQTIQMVTGSIDSFVKKDTQAANCVILYDDTVDASFVKVKEDLISRIGQDSAHAEYYLDLLMIAKYLERIGDHAVNVAEWVIFSVTGHHKDE